MSFELDLRAFIEKAKGNADQVVKKVGIDILASVIERSPVGNPELWKVNATAKEYNEAVMSYSIWITNNVPYGPPLEFEGHSKPALSRSLRKLPR